MTKKLDKDYHKKAVGYQIYPKSFKDSNADGIGDLQGIIEKLPYLKSLGIDFIWLNPIYASPQVDGGYDISDFYDIDPMFGTMADFKALLAKCHQLGMKLIMDLVVNHTSNQHKWFIEAQKSKDNPYRDYYLWADASPEKKPNNWRSFFGISAWTYQEQTQQAYFHIFAAEQPDLNWKNPKLRAEIYKMVRWWLEDIGIDGFRLDAISHIQKMDWDFELRSFDGDDPWEPFMNVIGIDNYLTDLKKIFNEFDATTVGEASGVRSNKGAADWTDADEGYLDAIFELEHNRKKSDGTGDLYEYKKVIMRWQGDLLERGWNALYIENHDMPRAISIFGDGSLASAKALAVQYMLLRGTPFIYYGQEIGMSSYPFESIDEISSEDTRNHYFNALKSGVPEKEAFFKEVLNSRDGARTPMQWNREKNAGFTEGQPWMPINPNYTTVNVEDSSELIALYRELISLRHHEKSLQDGGIRFHFPRSKAIFCYEREDFLVLVNLSDQKLSRKMTAIPIEDYQQVLGSRPIKKIPRTLSLSGWEYHVFKRKS
ncbi:MAG: alpha-glucosidase [Streptococcaceae bacterium]|jgi:alpha-glucosidase|nr:alpha-glucosidase [Streptococcaceae bacterium]